MVEAQRGRAEDALQRRQLGHQEGQQQRDTVEQQLARSAIRSRVKMLPVGLRELRPLKTWKSDSVVSDMVVATAAPSRGS